MIADYEKTSRTRWAGAMLLFAVLACVVLTNAYVAKADFTFGTPTNLGRTVNSWAGDGWPSISADGLELYFSSNRSGGYGGSDLWVTTRDTKDDEWGSPMNLGPTVNTSGLDRCPSISADGLSLFFGSKRAGGAGNMDVWVTTREMGRPWGAPVNLGPTVNGSSADCDPSISSDGLSLFFRSSAPGGFGRQDLWVTTRATSDDDWGPPAPVNLGPTVNSASKDYDPSISSDGLTLFFHSDRPGGYGKDDIYVTMRATTSDPWSMPMNLGPTINRSSVEGAPSISGDGSTLYFSSKRPGGAGNSDLWQVSISPVVDLNGDGIVDSADICIIIDHWGTDQPLCDVGPMPWGDGIVDVQDLIVLAEHLEDGDGEGFETGDFDGFDWSSIYGYGDSGWFVTSGESNSGVYSARAGSIDDDESSTLEVTLDCVSGDVRFYCKVSSESSWDYLRTKGRRTFRWTYSKDESSSDGSDTAWIDDITFPTDN